MYDRAIEYKHQQEIRVNRVLAEQFYHTVSDIDDLNIIKQEIAENITSKIQPAEIFAVLDNERNVIFYYSKHNSKEGTLKKLLPKIKAVPLLKEGNIKDKEIYYSWFINDFHSYTHRNYSLLIIYPLSSSVVSEFRQFFGLPFYISGFILCWVMVWASIILSSLVEKLQNQKKILSEQAKDIEKTRDQALLDSSAKSYFLANMSHEIRTPLTSIIGFAETSLDVNQSMEERSKATKIIIKSGKYLLNIINEILDLSKIESGRLEIENIPFSLMKVLDEINQLVSIMAENKELTFEVNYSYPLPEKIISDPIRLKQILLNLCSNAIKFTEKGHAYLNVIYEEESSNIIFEVIDTGIGISEKQQEKIFKPFEQADPSISRKFGGTGLGLTLSKQLAEMLKGNLFVESSIGKGSRFTLKLKVGEVEQGKYVHKNIYQDSVEKQSLVNTEMPQLSKY